MITTITLNTAIDKAYVVDELKKGEVNRVKTCSNTAGGKGLNVAKVVKLCKEEVCAAGFVGGHAGAYLEFLFEQTEIQNRFVYVKGETRSCINILAADGSSTEFLEPGEPVSSEELEAFYKEYQGILTESDIITISGSLPLGVESTVYQKLIERAKKAGKKVLLDTSKEFLSEGVKALPTLIKPNDDEIEMLLGITVSDRDALIHGAEKLHKMGIPYVAVSLGSEGALLITDDGIYHGKPPEITPVNTVGCGDSMTAAFAVGLSRNYDSFQMLKYAVAVSAANALTLKPGDFRQNDFERIYPQVKVIKL